MSEHKCEVEIELLKSDIGNFKSDMKEDMNEFKKDIREYLKEEKENRRTITDAVTMLSNNSIKLTLLVENQEKRANKLEEYQKQQSESLVGMKEQLILLEANASKNDAPIIDTDKQWYQSMFEKYGDLFFKLIIIVVIFALGLNADDIGSFFAK